MIFNPEQMPAPQEKKAAGKEEEKEEVMRTAFETNEGEKFFAERLVSPEDPRVEKVQKMLAKRFGKEEVDPVEVMKEAMTGRMATGEECPRYLVSVVENGKGKVEAMASGAAVELVDKDGELSKTKAVLIDAYTVVPEELRQKGVDQELFAMRERAAIEDAKKRGLEVVGYIVEDSGQDEHFYNRHEARRPYIELRHEKPFPWSDFIEVPYAQPPLDWDPKTGKPAEGAGTVPEHLMVKLMSGAKELPGKELMEMIHGMLFYNNYRERAYFESDKAFETHEAYLDRMVDKIAALLSGPGRTIRLLSEQEREELKTLGHDRFREQKTPEDLAREKRAARSRSSYRSAGGPRSRIEQSKRAARKFSKEK